MKRIGFVRQTLRFSLIPVALASLGACDRAGTSSELEDMRGSVIETDVITEDMLAPEAFSITDTALWDGRPTFGGVWIAYPKVETPERVRITNPETGETVIGALYKREDGFPGPQIELSADAAAALGVIAGTPTELRVVAMRRVEVEVDPALAGGPQPMVTPIARPSRAPAPVPEVEIPVVPVPDAPTVPTPEAAAAGEETPTVEATPLPAAPVAAAAVATEPAQAVPATPAPAAVTDPNSTFIQVATLQSLSRAEDAKAKLERAGLTVEIRESKSGSRTLYRVIVGPATSPEAAEIMMSVVREIGFRDAIPLR